MRITILLVSAFFLLIYTEINAQTIKNSDNDRLSDDSFSNESYDVNALLERSLGYTIDDDWYKNRSTPTVVKSNNGDLFYRSILDENSFLINGRLPDVSKNEARKQLEISERINKIRASVEKDLICLDYFYKEENVVVNVTNVVVTISGRVDICDKIYEFNLTHMLDSQTSYFRIIPGDYSSLFRGIDYVISIDKTDRSMLKIEKTTSRFNKFFLESYLETDYSWLAQGEVDSVTTLDEKVLYLHRHIDEISKQ